MLLIMEQLGIDRMSTDLRLALAQELIDSVIAERPAPPLSEGQIQEIRRRVTAYEANPLDVISAEEVHAKARARLQK